MPVRVLTPPALAGREVDIWVVGLVALIRELGVDILGAAQPVAADTCPVAEAEGTQQAVVVPVTANDEFAISSK